MREKPATPVSISGLNDWVLDVLRRTEDPCPLVQPPFRALPVAVHARKSSRFDLPDSGKPTDNE